MDTRDLARTICVLHTDSIVRWKADGVSLDATGFLRTVQENHAFNFELWHAEDRARRDDMGHEYVFQAKRAIDGYNQQRNNRMEMMDAWLWEALSPSTDPACPLHSETPGMMIDRLSILALKVFHMEAQTLRSDVDAAHREACGKKLETLRLQARQLAGCLEHLFIELTAKSRTYRVYHQMKMYNDPALNPELYRHLQNHQN